MKQRPVAKKPNTNVTRTAHGFDFRLYSTTIVSLNADAIILRTGGWKTATTKARMNQIAKEFGMHFLVSQRDHDWYVLYNGIEHVFDGDEITIPRVPATQLVGIN